MSKHGTDSFPNWYITFQQAALAALPRPPELDQDTALGWADNGKAFTNALAAALLPPKLVVAFSRMLKEKCPNCEHYRGRPGYQAMKCPKCDADFCGFCFISIPENDGKTIRCPGCRTILELPA